MKKSQVLFIEALLVFIISNQNCQLGHPVIGFLLLVMGFFLSILSALEGVSGQ